jgi:hypothetical protein
MPSLFLNSTNVELGKRFIVSNRLPSDRKDAYYAYDPHAEYRIVKLPVSTAIHLTARFPFVSPAGVLNSVDQKSAKNPVTWGRLVDGGYFENTGAATLADVIEAVESALKDSPRAADVRLYVLLILNNPEPGIPNDKDAGIPSLPKVPQAFTNPTGYERGSTPWSDYTAPVEALFAAQGARGFGDRYRLLRSVANSEFQCPGLASSVYSFTTSLILRARGFRNINPVEIRNGCGGYWEIPYPLLSHVASGTDPTLHSTDLVRPALGWVLSSASVQAMDSASTANNIDLSIKDHPVKKLRAALKEENTAR